MSIDISVNAGITAQFLATLGALTTSAQLANRAPIAFADGTGLGKVAKMHVSTRTLAASASETLDLAGGTLTDPQGQVVTFTKIKVLHVRPSASNPGTVIVGGTPANGFLGWFGSAANQIAIPPGGVLLIVDPNTGWTVTAGTGDLLKIANGSGSASATYDIEIFGE